MAKGDSDARGTGKGEPGAFPVLGGALPVLGHMVEMYKRFPSLCARGSAAHGPLFWIHGGPGAKQLMYTDAAALNLLKSPSVSTSFYAEGFGALLGNTLFAFDGDEHRRVRQAVTPPFTPQRVRSSNVLEIICQAVDARIASWEASPGFDVAREVGEIALEIIFRIVGVPVTRLDEWRKQYNRFLLAGIPSTGRIPNPVHWLAVRAREWLDAQLGEMVDQKRASQETSTLVGEVANGRTEDGRFIDRGLAVSNLRLLIFAGHETTASSIAWSLIHLASSRVHQQRLLAEAESAGDLAALAMDAQRFTFAEAAFREALRMYPPIHSVIRRVVAPIEADGRTIAKGTLINVPFVHLLRDPQRFPDPARFDPDRWKERPRPGTLETAMFGAGPHFCLGYHIAIAEGTLFNLLLGRLLSRRKLELRSVGGAPVPAPVFLPLTHPPKATKLCLVPASKGVD